MRRASATSAGLSGGCESMGSQVVRGLTILPECTRWSMTRQRKEPPSWYLPRGGSGHSNDRETVAEDGPRGS